MAIPSVPVHKFKVEIPSTAQTITMRPYSVAEEKLLKMVKEETNNSSIHEAAGRKIDVVKDIISRCVVSPEIDIDNLATFDVEFLLLKLCQESGGTTIKMNFHGDPESSCERCREDKRVFADLSQVKVVKKPEHTNKFIVVGDVGVVMKYPTYNTLRDMVDAREQNDIELILKLISSCIDKFYDGKTIYDDFTEKEAIEFLTNLTLVQIEVFHSFFDTMPSVELTIDLSCKACGKKDAYTLRGIHDFF